MFVEPHTDWPVSHLSPLPGAEGDVGCSWAISVIEILGWELREQASKREECRRGVILKKTRLKPLFWDSPS